MPSTNLCWIHSAKYLCSQDAQATLSKPSIHPFQRQDGPPRPMEHAGGAQGRGKGGERRICKERAAEVARERGVRATRSSERSQTPTTHPSVPHAPLSSCSVKDREETIDHLEKTIKKLDATNEDLRRQLREAVLLLRRAGDDLEKVGGSLTRKCAAAFVTIQAQHEAIRKLFQAHKAAVEGALIQHLTDSNRVIQDIVDDYRAIVSVPIQDCASTEKKAGAAPTQDP